MAIVVGGVSQDSNQLQTEVGVTLGIVKRNIAFKQA